MNSIISKEPSTLSQLVDVLEKFDEKDKSILLKELRKNLLIKNSKSIDSKISTAKLPRLSQHDIVTLCRKTRKLL
jgi:hypothetical protein